MVRIATVAVIVIVIDSGGYPYTGYLHSLLLVVSYLIFVVPFTWEIIVH